MSGILKIHSNGSGEWLFGHSWIEFISDQDGQAQTFGTWGNNPTGQGNGLFRNLELGRISDESRTCRIDDAQEALLFEKIASYRQMGEHAWSYLSPCSSFAEDVWESTTGEKLSHQSVLISNPSKLKESIAEANRRDMAKSSDATPQARQSLALSDAKSSADDGTNSVRKS